jgi:hypothetical protein
LVWNCIRSSSLVEEDCVLLSDDDIEGDRDEWADVSEEEAIAAAAEEAKMKEYKAWDIPKGRLVPFLIESTGALGPKAKELLADTAKRMGPMRLFSANYRYLCEAVSVAVQVTVQSQIVSLRFSQAEAAGARGAAAAG